MDTSFCIRHISDDKSTPFKQCGFVTRNTSKKCLNAIPSNQERGYCHSHLQVVGIIPKTERKAKVIFSGGGNGTTYSNNKNVSSASSSSLSSSPGGIKNVHSFSTLNGGLLSARGKRDDQKSVPRDILIKEENCQKVQEIPSSSPSPSHCSSSIASNNNTTCKNATFQTNKGKPFHNSSSVTTTTSSITGSKQPLVNNVVISGKRNNQNGSKVQNVSVVTSLQNSTTKHHTTVESQTTFFGNNKKEIRDCSKKANNNKTTTNNGNIQTNPKKKPLLSYSKSTNSGVSKNNSQNISIVSSSPHPPPVTTLCVRDRWKSFKFTPKNSDQDIKPAVQLQLEHMTSIKILEKLPLFDAEVANKIDDKNCVKLEGVGNRMNNKNNNSINNYHHSNSSPILPISSGIEILLVPPFLSTTKLYNNGRRNKVEHSTTTIETETNHENEESNQSETQVMKNCGVGSTPEGVGKDGRENNKKNNKKILSNEEMLLQPWELETRKEFLGRVRVAFKRQYKIIRKASKLSERQDKSDRAFRQALLTCALNDSSKCAQILVSSGDPKFGETTNNRQVKIESSDNNSYGFSSSPIIKNEKMSKKLKGKLSTPWKGNNNSICDPNLANDMNEKNDISNAKSANCNSVKISNSNGNYLWPSNGSSGQDSNNKKFKGSNKSSKTAKKDRDVNGNQSNIKSYANPNGIVHNNNKNNLNNGNGNGSNLNSKKKVKKPSSSPVPTKTSFKKRKVDNLRNQAETDVGFSHQSNGQLDSNDMVLIDSSDLLNSEQLLGVSSSVDLHTVSNLHSVSSSDTATTPEVITDASFDSPFDHSTSSQPDCEFSDDDLENSFEPNLLGDSGYCLIDPEIAHQASRLLEDNGLTEDDFNELFPETRMGDHKLNGRADLNDLGIDSLGFTSNSFDANDIDYSLFANIFPNFRSNQAESISVNHQF